MKQLLLLICLNILFCLTALSQTAEEHYKKASDFYENKDYSRAVIYIDKALQKDPKNAKYILLKGNAEAEAGKFQEALNTYTFGIQVNPRDAYLYNQRGLLLKKIQLTEEAINDFTTALEFNIDSITLSLLLNRGAAKTDIRDFKGAYDDYIEALKLDSLDIGILNNLAAVCDEVGKGDQTLKYLYKILEIDSTFIGAYGNIGFKYQQMGDYKTAISFFNKILELDPKDPLAYSNRAFNQYKLGHLDSALADINLSIRLYPSNSYAYRTRALIYISLKEINKACNDINEALKIGFTKMYGDEVEQLKKEHCIKNSL